MVKILVIEDSLFERKAVLNILQNNGYEDVIEASEGNEGILKCGTEDPDIVLLDLRMPRMDGLYVLDRIMEINPDMKIIITSIIRDKKTIEDCIKRGACKYISKPITKRKLISAVNYILEKK